MASLNLWSIRLDTLKDMEPRWSTVLTRAFTAYSLRLFVTLRVRIDIDISELGSSMHKAERASIYVRLLLVLLHVGKLEVLCRGVELRPQCLETLGRLEKQQQQQYV